MPDIESTPGINFFTSVPWVSDSASIHGVAVEYSTDHAGVSTMATEQQAQSWGEGHPVTTGSGLHQFDDDLSQTSSYGNMVAVLLVIGFSMFIATWMYNNAEGLSERIFGLVRFSFIFT